MDTLSKDQRSQVMARIRSQGNKSTELKLRSLLVRHGFRGWSVQPKGILGQPDFAFAEAQIAIFVDSCFWHGCPKHLRRPRSNRSYWDAKIDGNKRRDKRLTSRLRNNGWKVIRFWEHDICRADKVVRTLGRFGIIAS